MAFLRLASLVLLILITSVSGVMSVAHGEHAGVAMDMHGGDPIAGNHQGCCENGTERSTNCHVLPVLVPVTFAAHLAHDPTGRLALVRSTLLVGTEPAGPLDPPRSV